MKRIIIPPDIIYAENPGIDFLLNTAPYPELSEFRKRKKLRADCINNSCTARLLTKGDIASIIVPTYASYLASEMGIVDVNK